MKIERIIDGKNIEIELTLDELCKAAEALRCDFLRELLTEQYEMEDESHIEWMVDEANRIYLKGDGHTEVDALEQALRENDML